MNKQLIILALLLAQFTLRAQHDHGSHFQHAFLVIADTSKDYKVLQTKMFEINDQLNIEIDTMERTFNKKKGLITLPQNHNDEIYAGGYLPRTQPSEFISIEQMSFYTRQMNEKLMALVTGLYTDEKQAEKRWKKVRKKSKNAYILTVDIYLGCNH